MKLNRKKKYLQVALNGTLDDAREVIQHLPVSDRIIVEAGTPLIKRYGEEGIRKVRSWYASRIAGTSILAPVGADLSEVNLNLSWSNLAKAFLAPDLLRKETNKKPTSAALPATGPEVGTTRPYVVADLKTMDRGATEVDIAWRGGASAAIALGSAPVETLNAFIAQCEERGLDAMVDMMNVEYPLSVLSQLKKTPPVVILHRGVDEEAFNREKQIPLHEIRRIKSRYDIMISIAGGDTLREVQRSVFNDADIVVVWKSVYQQTSETVDLINGFLNEVK